MNKGRATEGATDRRARIHAHGIAFLSELSALIKLKQTLDRDPKFVLKHR
jgi:hypothetical protein